MTVKIRDGMRESVFQTVRADYDFAKKGGAIGTIPLIGRALIPNGFTVVGGWIEVVTALVGATATIAVQVEAAGDIVPATAVATWSLGRKAIVPAMDTSAALAAAKNVRLTAARDVSVVIAVAALTAGKFSVILHVQPPLK